MIGLYSNNFAEVFSRLLEKSGVTNYKVSQYTGINEGYLSRLKKGVKENPSPEVLVKISLALVHFSQDIKLHHIEDLFNAVGKSLLTNKKYI